MNRCFSNNATTSELVANMANDNGNGADDACERLNARAPYDLAVRIGARLCPLDSPGDFEDWDIYWLAGVTALRSIWHCLKEQDRTRSDLLRAIFDDFNEAKWGGKSPILEEFVRSGRDKTIKRWDWDIAVQTVSYRRLIEPDTALVSSKELLWQNDEDALRLYEIALVEWHRSLCIIEQANKEGIEKPFSTGGYNKELLGRSRYADTLPHTPRL
jgi:hypothetical protein